MQDLSNKTLSQIVTDHYQTARVFEKYGLDFCCKGKRLLVFACEEKQLPYEEVLKELYQVLPYQDQTSEFSRITSAGILASATTRAVFISCRSLIMDCR